MEIDDKGNVVPTLESDLPFERVHILSDSHVNHKRILLYCHRGQFMTQEEKTNLYLAEKIGHEAVKKVYISDTTLKAHNETILSNINASVGVDDALFILGDFAMTRDIGTVRYWRNWIACRNVWLTYGNHDPQGIKDAGIFNSVYYCMKVKVGDKLLVMKHWPILDREWKDPSIFHLHGHHHGNLNVEHAQKRRHQFILDVGVDSHNFKPWNLREICEVMEKRRVLGEQNAS